MRCSENQHFESCGTDCPLTCDNYNNPPLICNLMCVARCFCDDGYVEKTMGECVKPEDCPKIGILQTAQDKTCLSRPETGMCRAYFPMWYYDATTGKCKTFVYGGCQGNGNRYRTEQECLENCGDVRVSNTEICALPADSGICMGPFDRYYFDSTSGECKTFNYGGCGGNLNNFETIEECNEKCLSPGESN
ncbi:carboxypeptidase inhibitor SmCI [Nephila pilipes]|uniref:Carboxypeptidase inhibitor SmCI n=1 Tax=Nephila pilipes TaxID=299642 RepID=A0A8X6UIH6_NEPPI|nr:carboxypeptidase inhibitor SmCI [Nephila pilipes]